MKTGKATLTIGAFRLGRVGLTVNGSPSFAEWQRAGRTLRHLDEKARWWRGDWIAYGETRTEWGDKYEHECNELGLDYGTVRNLKSLSKVF